MVVLLVWPGGPDALGGSWAPAPRCSKTDFTGPKWPTSAFFTATATADSVVAFPTEALADRLADALGRQRQSGHAGGLDADPAIRGLFVAVDRVEVRDPALVEGHDRWILIPWDYDAACRALPWPRGVDFLPDGHRGFMSGVLRARTEWVDGFPTVDVHNTRAQGYPGDAVTLPGDPDADQLFDFHRAMPWLDEVEAEGYPALEPTIDWLSAHPAIADSDLLSWALTGLISASNSAEARRYASPILGTWRIDWTLPGGDTVGYWIRTEAAPYTSERIRSYPWTDRVSLLAVRSDVESRLRENGYRIQTWVTLDAEAAVEPAPHPRSPDATDELRRLWPRSPRGLAVERADRTEAGALGPLRVDAQADEAALIFDDPVLSALKNDHFRDFQERVASGERIHPAGRFVRDDGDWRLEAEWTLLDGRVIRMRGVRVNELFFAAPKR
jgi:hypothetical protein